MENEVRDNGEFLGWVGDVRYYLYQGRMFVMPLGREMMEVIEGNVDTIRALVAVGNVAITAA